MKFKIIIFSAAVFFGCNAGNKPMTGQAIITVTDSVINNDYRGVGFHAIFPISRPSKWQVEQVFGKRWRELNPGFARVNDNPSWDTEDLDKFSEYLDILKDTGTEMYFTSFGVSDIHNYKNEWDYVKKEVDHLEYIKKTKGFDNLKYYCMTNELSMDYWASMVKENKLDDFKRIHQLFYDEINRRNLDIKLLASDASPFEYWYTIQWAADSMDNITGIYGGHHYINSYGVFDPTFYRFFLGKMQWAAALAGSKGKRFIMGEFGPKQSHSYIDSISYDAIIYNNTPLEPYVPIQVAEAVMAQMNGGIYASGYWTFADMPTQHGAKYANKWGIFKWYFDNFTTRPNYYALGLLVKFMRGPAVVFNVNSSDTLIRVAAVKNTEKNTYSIAVVNRNRFAQPIKLNFCEAPDGTIFRKYVYDPADPPFNYFGDLQSYSKKVTLEDQKLSDTLPAYSLVVYTSSFDETPPTPVEGLTVTVEKFDRDRNVLRWKPNTENDFCYYRIYRSTDKNVEVIPVNQIASTISNEWMDNWTYGQPRYYYKVVAVDDSENSSD
jgi:hypothetical protein